MIVDGLFLGALVGAMAYNSAKMEGAREAFLSWVFGTVFIVVVLVASAFDFDLAILLQHLTGSVVTLFLVTAGTIALGMLAGWFARWTLKLNLSPARVGLIFFGLTYLTLNIVYFYFRVKEPA